MTYHINKIKVLNLFVTEDDLKLAQVISLTAVFSLFTSCAWLDRMERGLTGSEAESGRKTKKQMIPKAEYDELLSRYDELNRQYQALKEGKSSSLVNELEATPQITNSGIENGSRVETVDVFSAQKTSAIELGDIESQLMKYRQAEVARATAPVEALKVYQQLALSGAPSLKAKAQLRMGEILLQQGEFDLALQSFEVVITKLAYSGVVLEALRNAAICCEKLGLVQKKDQYLSLLKDVFQV